MDISLSLALVGSTVAATVHTADTPKFPVRCAKVDPYSSNTASILLGHWPMVADRCADPPSDEADYTENILSAVIMKRSVSSEAFGGKRDSSVGIV